MSYTPTEWACGDTITAEKLNKLENGLADCCGGGGEAFIIRYDDESEDDSYISNYSVYDLSEENKVPTYFERGTTLYPIQLQSGTYFTFLHANPYDSPQMSVTMFIPDQDDESGTKFNALYFSSDVTFTENE